MNVYEFYLSTCKYVLLADHASKSTWSDLYSYLPCLRQMLSCCVCGNILLKPKGPSHGYCLHHVCSDCIGGKMRLRPVCSWCRTHESFVDNNGLRILVLCFQRMCQYINTSKIGQEIRRTATNGANTNTLIRLLDEAIGFRDDYIISNKVMPTCVPTYGMAPEPKLVTFPRNKMAVQPATTSIIADSNIESGHDTVCVSGQHSKQSTIDAIEFDTHQDISTVKVSNHDLISKDTVKSSEIGDADLKSSLLTPCSQDTKSEDMISLSESHISDGLYQKSCENWDKQRKKCYRSSSGSKLLKRRMIYSTKKTRSCPRKTTSNVEQVCLDELDHKRDDTTMDFEPLCRRTRLASSLVAGRHDVEPGHDARCNRRTRPLRLASFDLHCAQHHRQLSCLKCSIQCCRSRDGLLARANSHGKDLQCYNQEIPAPTIVLDSTL